MTRKKAGSDWKAGLRALHKRHLMTAKKGPLSGADAEAIAAGMVKGLDGALASGADFSEFLSEVSKIGAGSRVGGKAMAAAEIRALLETQPGRRAKTRSLMPRGAL